VSQSALPRKGQRSSSHDKLRSGKASMCRVVEWDSTVGALLRSQWAGRAQRSSLCPVNHYWCLNRSNEPVILAIDAGRALHCVDRQNHWSIRSIQASIMIDRAEARAHVLRLHVEALFTSHANPKYLIFHPSHRIFKHMNGALNVGKKITNYIVCL
jgi:hypothetical protein